VLKEVYVAFYNSSRGGYKPCESWLNCLIYTKLGNMIRNFGRGGIMEILELSHNQY